MKTVVLQSKDFSGLKLGSVLSEAKYYDDECYRISVLPFGKNFILYYYYYFNFSTLKKVSQRLFHPKMLILNEARSTQSRKLFTEMK